MTNNTNLIIDRIIKSDKRKLLYLYIYQNKIDNAIEIINLYANGEEYDIQEVLNQYEIAYSKCPDIIVANAQARELLNKPKCPTCSSTNISKIGGLERGANIAAFGIFSKKINKTFKCGNCGYTW